MLSRKRHRSQKQNVDDPPEQTPASAFDGDPVESLFYSAGRHLGRTREEIEPIVRTVVVGNRYDSIDSIRRLSDRQWSEMRVPSGLVVSIRLSLPYLSFTPAVADISGVPNLSSVAGELVAVAKTWVNRIAYEFEEAVTKSSSKLVNFITLPAPIVRMAGIHGLNPDRDIRLYVRPRCRTEIQLIRDEVIRQGMMVHIEGHFGTGKSSTALYVALCLARDEDWNVLWIHLQYTGSEVGSYACLHIRPGGRMSTAKVQIAKIDELVDNFQYSHQGQAGNLVIIDGIVVNDSTPIPGLTWVQNGNEETSKRRLIRITSKGTTIEVKMQDFQLPIVKFLQWSWEINEYEAAYSDSSFKEYADVLLDAPLEVPGGTRRFNSKLGAKFYFAGGCARYMFLTPTNLVKSSMDQSLESIAMGAPTDINDFKISDRLLARYKGNETRVVSEYATQQMISHLGSAGLENLARNYALRDRFSALVIIFKQWFFARVIEGKIVNFLRAKSGSSLPSWNHTSFKSMDITLLNRNNCPTNQLIRPMNQFEAAFDCFDFLLSRTTTVRFFQITSALTHDMDLRIFGELAQRLEADVVEIYFFVPDAKFDHWIQIESTRTCSCKPKCSENCCA